MQLLLLRPYYGVNINSDMHGDLGVIEYYSQLFPDLSLVYAASIAKLVENVEVDIVEANAEMLFPAETLARLKKQYDVIVLKATAPTVKFDLEFARHLKGLYPESRIIVCGHVVKILKKWILKNMPEIDEITEKPLGRCIYKILTGREGYCSLNDFPSPDFSLFPYKNFKNVDGILRGSLYMSRACVMGCRYCPYTSFYGKQIETRSIDKVITDIKQLLKLGIKMIVFRDQYFSWSKKNVEELCRKIIKKKLKFSWSCETRIDSLNTGLIDLMAEAGMDMVLFGVESGSDEILSKYNRKTFEHSQAHELIKYLNDRHIQNLGFYILGFPAETWNSMHSTLGLAQYLNSSYVRFGLFTPNLSDGITDNTYKSHEISPDIFVPFKDHLAVSPSMDLDLDVLNYFRDQATIMFYAQKSGLKCAYDFEYIYQHTLNKKIDKITNYLKTHSLFELSSNWKKS